MTEVHLDATKSMPAITINMEGLALITYLFRLRDEGFEILWKHEGDNKDGTQQVFALDAPLSVAQLDQHFLELVGTVTALDGTEKPYSVAVVLSQDDDKHPVKVDNMPETKEGRAHYDTAAILCVP